MLNYYMTRPESVQEKISDLKVDAFLVSSKENVYYLSGFRGLGVDREAWILVTKEKLFLLTSPLNPSVTSALKGFEMVIVSGKADFYKKMNTILKKCKVDKLGFEALDLRVGEYENFKNNLPATFISTIDVVERLRAIKDKEERDSINKACQLTDQCLSQIAKLFKIGVSEKEIAYKIELWLRNHDVDLAFPPIVAFDKNTAIPHYDSATGDGKIHNGSVILVDFGARFKHYCSDMTRVFVVGSPTTEFVNYYNLVQKTQEKTVAFLKKEKSAASVDNFCRETIRRELKQPIPHSVGHGVGLDIHEFPKISPNSKDILEPGNVITIEPGIYLEGRCGIRIEDTLCINSSLEPEILTKFDKKLRIL